MIGYGLDRGGPKDSENAPNSFLTKINENGFRRFAIDILIAMFRLIQQAAQHMRALEIDPGSTLTRDILRRQYIAMVKKYHPDTATNSDEASMEKFMQVDEVSSTLDIT